ncbi:SNARE complex subunit [Mycena chlorophos]|uniref:SNARE complex subunit n=1 Tax=Mycena chlorophos TaxID=658473 RepID=A0A8H6T5G4_MYCCL|nr:SNARE complex subunit [Mycena chlorophos]
MAQRRAPSTHSRASLLGPTPPASGRSSPMHHYDYEPSGQRFADDLEGQNDEALEGLSAKVKLLKDVPRCFSFWLPVKPYIPQITVGIGNEVRESTKQLSEMNDAFAETGTILSGTFRRMNNMAERQGCRWLWYIVFLILVFWFFVVVWWFRR